MGTKVDDNQRQAFIHLIRSGRSVAQAAQELGRARSWGYKWKVRYEQEGWAGLKEKSRAPHYVARKTSPVIRQEILRVRSVLEAEALESDKLGYIGAAAIYGRLSARAIQPLPGVSTIERLLRQAGMTKPRLHEVTKEVVYPHLQPTTAHQLTQVDIVPHYLKGGREHCLFQQY
jgi:hypothetical protein